SSPPFRSTTTTVDISICSGDPGVYIDTLTATNGCDSIVIFNVSVLPPIIYTIDTSICEGDTFNGISLSGTYMDTLIAENGCDSIVIIKIQVVPLNSLAETHELCPGEEIYGLSQEGVYQTILPSKNSCDTVLTVLIIELSGEDPSCITGTFDQGIIDVNLFPNPVNNILQIQTGSNDYEMELINSHGHSLM